MKNMLSLFATVLLLVTYSCNNEGIDENGCLSIIIDEDLFENGAQDASTVINSVKVEEKCLIISLSYTGGCESHDIKFVTNGFESLSNPPIWYFKLIHDNNDPCEAYLTEDWE